MEAGAVQVSEEAIFLVMRMEPLREHAVGQRLGPLLLALPPWRELLTSIVPEPIAQLDTLMLTGASFSDGSSQAMVLVTGRSPESLDVALELLGRRVPEGVVRGTGARVDGAFRVLQRRGQVVQVTAASGAQEAPRGIPTAERGEVVALRLKEPHRHAWWVPEKVLMSRLRIRTQGDGAELWAEGDCATAEDARLAAEALRARIRETNGLFVRLATRGVLNDVRIETLGSRLEGKLTANRAQLEATLALVAAHYGATLTFSDDAGVP